MIIGGIKDDSISQKNNSLRMFYALIVVSLGKLFYDVCFNQLQLNSYGDTDQNIIEKVWNELGDDAWEEAKRARYGLYHFLQTT